jgi:hypothetical protein
MNTAQHSPHLRDNEGEEIDVPRRYLTVMRSDRRRLNELLGRGLFETIIVAVFIANGTGLVGSARSSRKSLAKCPLGSDRSRAAQRTTHLAG